MRIFIALDIDEAIRKRLQLFLDGVRGFAPDARWVRPESLHVTLKFIGEKSCRGRGEIKRALSAIRAGVLSRFRSAATVLSDSKAPRVFWVGIEAGPQLAALAKAVDEATAAVGVPKEEHAFSPHLTLARRVRLRCATLAQRGWLPTAAFQRLQEKLAAMPAPEFGTMTAREFFLYESQLDARRLTIHRRSRASG